MSIQERLQMVIKMHNLSSSSFADEIGVQRSNVSHVLSGRNKPSLDFLEKILNAYPRVNAHWLITGQMPAPVKGEESDVPKDVSEKVIEPPKESTVSLKGGKKPLEKVLLIYKDGSFDALYPNEL